MKAVRQGDLVRVYRYPDHERLGEAIHHRICELPSGHHQSYVLAKQTSYRSFAREFRGVCEWVREELMPQVAQASLRLIDLWGVLYQRGGRQGVHNHDPMSWSFVYFVNAPPGAAPLCFARRRTQVPAVAGNCAVFPSWASHFVPLNACDDRSVLVGNFI